MSPLLFLILLPFVAALFIMVGAPARFTALLATGLNLLLAIFLFSHYDRALGGWQYIQETPVLPSLKLNFLLGADGLSLTMLLLATLVSFSALWVSPQLDQIRPFLKLADADEVQGVDGAEKLSVQELLDASSTGATKQFTAEVEFGKGAVKRSSSLFYVCLLLISGGVIGAFAAMDAFFLYAFHEIALIPVFIMIGLWGSGDRQAAAWKATLYLGTGSFVVLLGIVALYVGIPSSIRTFDLRSLAQMSQTGIIHPASWIYLLFLFGFGTLVSLFPFHSWAPATYASAPPPTAMLHAGVLKKFGLYGLLRLALPVFPEAVAHFTPLLLCLLVGNILYVGYVTLAQRRLDWTIAYSSVMHMGTIFLGLAAMNLLSLSGATLLMFAHGVSVAALFALSGALRQRTGTLEYSELGGLAKVAPTMSLFFGFATMASIGLPGLANFAGEILIFFGATAAAVINHGSLGFTLATIAAVWGVVLSAVYMLRAYRAVFFGSLVERWKDMPDLSRSEFWAILLLIVTLVVVGVFPRVLLQMVTTAF
ncbi:MAG TPA: NADH-quinone oxidoreductase subunit M [Chthoniobacterales bacterium]|nr:NADH-quinone oxidoreductase subunit M [Chthoniobacterales bacterium]